MSLSAFIRNSGYKNLWNSSRLISCWSCGNDSKSLVSNLFCSNCKVLQQPEKDANYFALMGVSETFDLDENDLAKRYKELQKYLHPDKFANKERREQEISEKYSSLVNEAYKTLLDPLSRGSIVHHSCRVIDPPPMDCIQSTRDGDVIGGIYMLHLRGKDMPENTEVDQEFLMTIMEKNEEVENAETEAEIMELNEEIKIKIKQLQKQVSEAFFDGKMSAVLTLLSHMKYYTSIDTQIQAVIRSKGIIR